MADQKPFNPFLSPEETSSAAVQAGNVIRPARRPETPVSDPKVLRPKPVVNQVFSPSPPQPSSVPSGPPISRSSAPASITVAPQVLEPEHRGRRYVSWLIYFLLVLLIGGTVWYVWNRFKPQTIVPQDTETAAIPKETTQISETTPPEILSGNAEYTSENFRAGEIVFGGELAFLQSEDEIAPLEISAIRGEAFTEKGKQEVKLVVTWQTNKLSLANVEYAKGVGQNKKIATEDDYSFNHSMIISGLDPASTYLYTIKASDRFGGTIVSEPYAVFTGSKSVSLFDLIAGAIGDVFGWAVDK